MDNAKTDDRYGGVLTLGLRETGPGVYYSGAPFVCADGTVVSFLKDAARRSPMRRARLCAHPSPEAEQQDMLIASLRDTYVPPHRHLQKSESLIVVEGTAIALFFDDDARLTRVLPLGPQGSGRTFFYRMPERVFHSLLVESEVFVFVESTRGPFRPDASQVAPWAPAAADEPAVQRFREDLTAAAARFLETPPS